MRSREIWGEKGPTDIFRGKVSRGHQAAKINLGPRAGLQVIGAVGENRKNSQQNKWTYLDIKKEKLVGTVDGTCNGEIHGGGEGGGEADQAEARAAALKLARQLGKQVRKGTSSAADYS